MPQRCNTNNSDPRPVRSRCADTGLEYVDYAPTAHELKSVHGEHKFKLHGKSTSYLDYLMEEDHVARNAKRRLAGIEPFIGNFDRAGVTALH